MKILNGRKYLDANDYKKISITDTNNKFNIRVSGEDKKDIQYTKTFISDEIKSLSDEAAILFIIDYYLRYNEIVSVMDSYNFRTKRDGIELISSNDKKLYLSVNNNIENKHEIIKRIKNGFNLALLNNLTRDDIDFVTIHIGCLKQNNFFIKNNIEKKQMCININQNDVKTLKFLMNIVFERLKDTDEIINLILPKKKIYLGLGNDIYDSNIYIKNENISFNIEKPLGHNNEFINFISEEINAFNEEKEKIKIKQLKLGGF